VGTNNYQFGVEGAKLMAEALNGSGKVAIIQIVGQTNLNERAQGFKDHMAANHPGIEIVGTIDDKGDQVVAANATRAFLQANPDIDGIISVDALGGAGAAVGIEEMGYTDKIVLIGADRDDNTLKLVEDGKMYASVAQKSALMSYLGTKLLYYYNHGRIPITLDDEAAGILPVPANIDTGTVFITKENAKYFYHE
jgi:ribose transport system substrate-binding protein